jgi:hypothetical protein
MFSAQKNKLGLQEKTAFGIYANNTNHNARY